MYRSLALILIALVFSCKTEKEQKKEKITTPEKTLSISEKIAHAHGYKNWEKVKTFGFTFGGKIENANSGRSWIWNPKTDDIILVRNGDTTNYNRKDMDSVALKADRGFINDKFWALIPFQLIWDSGLTISDSEKATSPVNQQEFNKITITYSSEGGYTPGDAYDIYYDNDYIIKEWGYRKGNDSMPSLSNTFENYKDYKGIKIAQDHKKAEGDWNLLVRNIKVELEE